MPAELLLHAGCGGDCHPRVAVWLQLRLGGALRPMLLSSAWLMSEAIDLPSPAPLADLAWIS